MFCVLGKRHVRWRVTSKDYHSCCSRILWGFEYRLRCVSSLWRRGTSVEVQMKRERRKLLRWWCWGSALLQSWGWFDLVRKWNVKFIVLCLSCCRCLDPRAPQREFIKGVPFNNSLWWHWNMVEFETLSSTQWFLLSLTKVQSHWRQLEFLGKLFWI